METVTLAGATVFPPVFDFYHQPRTIDDLLDHAVGKVFDQFSIPQRAFPPLGLRKVSGLDQALRGRLAGAPPIGQLDQAFLLLTVDASGAVDVCLLSRAELRAGNDGLAAVVASRRARAHLDRNPVATVVVVCDDVVHTLVCRVVDRIDGDGAAALGLTVERHGKDGLGIELQPLRFRVDEKLRVDERWDRTEALLADLAARTGSGGQR